MGSKNKEKTITKLNFGITSFLLITGFILAVYVVLYHTTWFDYAAKQSLPNFGITNLNSASDIISTINPDGTMGPQTSNGNWSNSLPAYLKGKLVFAVTDPPQGKKPDNPGDQKNNPTESVEIQPTTTLPTQATYKSKSGHKNGPQEVSALNLTFKKVEVHIAYQGGPGEIPEMTPGQKIKPTQVISKKGEKVNKWETLNIVTPVTVDFVQLAILKDFSILGITDLAAGKYTQIRMYVESASATLLDGTIVELQMHGHNNIVKVVHPFTVEVGESTKLTLDIDAQRSVVKAGDNYFLKPVVSRLIKEKLKE